MKYLIVALMLFIIVVAGCTDTGTTQQRKTFEDKEQILAALDKLTTESYSRNLTVADLKTLEPLLPDDHAIEDFYSESVWLAEHNQGEHIGHSLSFIYGYVRDGVPLICVPHEIDHLNLYIRYNDTRMIQHALEESQEGYDEWVAKSEQARKLLPSYYKDFDTLKKEVRLAMEKVEQKDYEGAMPHIEYVSLHQVC